MNERRARCAHLCGLSLFSGPGYDGVVYDAYEIAPDPERIACYRLLWDMA